jgi:hypothetical protein
LRDIPGSVDVIAISRQSEAQGLAGHEKTRRRIRKKLDAPPVRHPDISDGKDDPRPQGPFRTPPQTEKEAAFHRQYVTFLHYRQNQPIQEEFLLFIYIHRRSTNR